MGAAALPIAAVLTAATMYSQLKSAQASAKGLMTQGAMAKVQARSEALKFKQQGVAVLENINAHQAAINNRAGAGNIDPTSDSAKTLSILAERKGAFESYNTIDGGTIQLAMGDIQAHQYASAAKATMAAGRMQALATATQFAVGYATLGGAPAGGGGATTASYSGATNVYGVSPVQQQAMYGKVI